MGRFGSLVFQVLPGGMHLDPETSDALSQQPRSSLDGTVWESSCRAVIMFRYVCGGQTTLELLPSCLLLWSGDQQVVWPCSTTEEQS